MGNIGGPEIILILLVVFVFFGAKKIPEIAKGLGEGIREFRKAARDVQTEIEKRQISLMRRVILNRSLNAELLNPHTYNNSYSDIREII